MMLAIPALFLSTGIIGVGIWLPGVFKVNKSAGEQLIAQLTDGDFFAQRACFIIRLERQQSGVLDQAVC